LDKDHICQVIYPLPAAVLSVVPSEAVVAVVSTPASAKVSPPAFSANVGFSEAEELASPPGAGETLPSDSVTAAGPSSFTSKRDTSESMEA